MRKYKKGKCLKSMDKVLKCDFVYVGDKIYHLGWVGSWQASYLKRLIDQGTVYEAVKIEKEKKSE